MNPLRTWAIVLCAAAAGTVGADDGKLSGSLFGDYYYVVAADDGAAVPQKRNAFQLRRTYLTYDRALSDRFDVRLRLEANDPGFGSRERMTPYLKNAYLRWQEAVGGAELYLGESNTPTWELSEKAWGYRAIEKTILDLNGIGSSADIGAALKGRVGRAAYHLMVGNGPGQRPESDNGKKLYAAVSLNPDAGTVVELYGDLNRLPGGQDQLTAKAFLGLRRGSLSCGLEPFVRSNRKAGAAGDDVTLAGASAFAAAPVGNGWKAFGRLDVLGDDAADTTALLAIAGLDWAVADGVNLMPNLYLEVPDGPDPSLQARVTGFFQF